MKLKRASDIRLSELPFVENPFFASSDVRSNLERVGGNRYPSTLIAKIAKPYLLILLTYRERITRFIQKGSFVGLEGYNRAS